MKNNTENADWQEQLKFDALAADWWDPQGPLRTLHHINPVRLRYIEQSITLKDKSILDLGCGGGLLAEAMARRRAKVTGLDISDKAIAVAAAHKDQEGLDIEYIVVSAEQHAGYNKEKYDVITCMELLEHVPDVQSLLQACAGMLKPGGDMFLATINRSLYSYVAAIVGAEYLLNLLPKGTHDYARFIRPSELRQWMLPHRLELVDVTGLTYIPGINKCTLVRKPTVNYIAHAKLGEA